MDIEQWIMHINHDTFADDEISMANYVNVFPNMIGGNEYLNGFLSVE